MTLSNDDLAAARTPGESRDPATEPPKETSKPIGDAIPAPPEPGLDQPLPPKETDEPDDGDTAKKP